ncbi:MAG: hypothetical protein DHS80DRAFT_30852 [Piptocephalis tieghemiana]|nr:MAG: hypothetical protein DHS80DRAFT_30852 [Piptocephalis tieghemiana]
MQETQTDCLSCRLVGTAVFAGTGGYAFYLARPPSLSPPKRLGLLSLGFLVLGAYRWRM